MKKITFMALALTLIIPVSSYGIDGQRKISQTPSTTFPITINQPGSYVLTSNLVVTAPNVHAIEITTNDVTLDLNGHTIQGPATGPGSGCGVYSFDRYSITITNGKVWGFGHRGIYLGMPNIEGAGHKVEDIQAMSNVQGGIDIYEGVITNCIANSNGEAGIYTGRNSIITNCTATKNVTAGFVSSNATVNNCTANWNGIGFSLVVSAVNNCTANWNGSDGFWLNYSTATNCTAFYNNGIGFYANKTNVIQCTSIGNVGHGIECLLSHIKDCVVLENTLSGIYSTSDSHIVGNNIRNNGGYGLFLSSSTGGDYVIKNILRNNSSGNINYGANNYCPVCGPASTDNCNHVF